jgi:hypothetical protein
MALTAAQVSTLATASPAAIAAGATRVRRNFADSRWLATRNRYRVGIADTLAKDAAPTGVVSARNLAEYIAASAPLHCCDGWAFLGRAVGCHLHGDADTARHLAYYAELRAAMCLLAVNGVGIFRNRHYVIDGAGMAHPVSRDGTHVAAWDALELWSGQPAAASLLGQVLRPAGRPIDDWLVAMPGGSSWQPIATRWLQVMGLDVRFFAKDRDARNEASYRPTRLNRVAVLPSGGAADAACELWRLLEPAPPSTFADIDRYLLRLTLESAFFATSGSTHRQAPVRFRGAIETVVNSVVAGDEADRWRAFLLRETAPTDPLPLDLAQRVTALRRADHHLAVMGRAVLLLRVASGAAREMLIQAGLQLDDVSFWWHPYGESRGLWRQPPATEDLTDAWADIAEILDQLADAPPATYWALLATTPDAFARFTSLETVGLWSLAA